MKDVHPSVFLNDAVVEQSASQKYLGKKLDLNTHIKEKINKVNRGICLTRKLQSKLPRNTLTTIYNLS